MRDHHIKKTTWIVAGLLLLLLVASLLLLRHYKLDLIQHVVLSAVVQKAPPQFPESEIRQAFAEARLKVRGEAQRQLYLEHLLRLSQRLEKIQSLDESELRKILADLRRR